jgi:hypothetical protein
MNIGTPGSGLGGLFYLISALIMLPTELWTTVKGKSSRQRWMLVVTQIGMGLGMIGTTLLTVWIIGLIFPGVTGIRIAHTPQLINTTNSTLVSISSGLVVMIVTVAPLLLVLGLVQALRGFYRLRATKVTK